MTTQPFSLLDTRVGDRVLNAAAIAELLTANPQSFTAQNLTVAGDLGVTGNTILTGTLQSGAATVATLISTGLATLGSMTLDTGSKVATASGTGAGTATLAKNAGVITSPALTTAAGATWALTLTNSDIAAADQVFASVALGDATTGAPAITSVTPGAGSVVITVQNVHASAALNGTIKVAFAVFKN